jgi:hypothetical protein
LQFRLRWVLAQGTHDSAEFLGSDLAWTGTRSANYWDESNLPSVPAMADLTELSPVLESRKHSHQVSGSDS